MAGDTDDEPKLIERRINIENGGDLVVESPDDFDALPDDADFARQRWRRCWWGDVELLDVLYLATRGRGAEW